MVALVCHCRWTTTEERTGEGTYLLFLHLLSHLESPAEGQAIPERLQMGGSSSSLVVCCNPTQL